MKYLRTKLFTALLTLLTISCHNDRSKTPAIIENGKSAENFKVMLEKESKNSTRNDSVFCGIYLHMRDSAFFNYCTSMFKKGIFNGGYDYQVEVRFSEMFKRPVQVKFYPKFDSSFITKIPCRFSYVNASIYNKADRADKLISELLPVMMRWYGGNPFVQMSTHNPLKEFKYLKVDGNRQITIAEGDNVTDADVEFKDLKPFF